LQLSSVPKTITQKQKYTPCYIYAEQAGRSHSLRPSSTRLDNFHRAPVAAAALIGAQEKASVGVARPGRVLRSVVTVVVSKDEQPKALFWHTSPVTSLVT